MGRIKKTVCNTAVIILILFMMFSMAGTDVHAGEGNISIRLNQKNKEGIVENITFNIYLVGTVDEHTKTPAMNEKYKIASYPQSTGEIEEALEKLGKMKPENPHFYQKTNGEGIALFTDLPEGVYFILAEEPNAYGTIQPLLVHLPFYENVSGKIENPNYNIEVEPKAKIVPPDPEEPKNPENPEDPEKPIYNEPDAHKVKTGDEAKIASLIAILAVGIIIIIIIGYKRNHKGSC